MEAAFRSFGVMYATWLPYSWERRRRACASLSLCIFDEMGGSMLASTEQPHNSALAPTPVLSPQKVPAGLRKLQQNDEKPCECESGLKSWHHLQDSCSAARRAMANLKPTKAATGIPVFYYCNYCYMYP